MNDLLRDLQAGMEEGLGDSPSDLVQRALLHNAFRALELGGPRGDVLLDERFMARHYPDVPWTAEMVAEAVEELRLSGRIRRCSLDGDYLHFYTTDEAHGFTPSRYRDLPWHLGS